MVVEMVPVKGGRWHIIPQLAVYNKWYILPIGGLYATYHLLREPETTIDDRFSPISVMFFLTNGSNCIRSANLKIAETGKQHFCSTGMSMVLRKWIVSPLYK